jgi:hypothetical protein
MGTCRAISLVGIFLMLASGPARAQEEPAEQREQREPGAPGEPQGSQPGETSEQARTPPGDPDNAVTEEEQRILTDLAETKDRPWTEGVPLEKRQRAYERFLDGNDDIREAFFGKAADKYKEALALWEHPAFHYNLGIAQMNLDQPIEAYARFLAARKHGPEPITDEKYRLTQKYLDTLRKQLGEIEVTCNEPGAEVAVDGKPIFAGPGRQHVMVRPGGHRVEASKRGLMPDAQQVVINPGDSKRVTVAPQLPEHLVTVRRWPQWIPWAVAGTGAVALAGAGVLDWHSTRLFDQFDHDFGQRCPGSTNGCPDGEIPGPLRAQLANAHRWQWAARTTYAVGGLSVAASAALIYLNRERAVRGRIQDESSTIVISPMLMPHHAGVSALLRF